jgi:hypothetical protein
VYRLYYVAAFAAVVITATAMLPILLCLVVLYAVGMLIALFL